jgi:hypothetical protein
MLSSYAPSRYYILFMPAIVGLAARSAGRLDRRLAAIAVAGFVLVSGYWLGRAWAQRQGNMRAAGVLLQRALPAGATVVGEFAPALCLGTRLKAAPVQPGLSNDAMPAETLRAAGVLVTDAPYWHRWWLGHDPRCVGGRPLEEFVIGGTREIQVEFYRVKD